MIFVILLAVGIVLAAVGGSIVWRKRRPRVLKADRFQDRWQELQKMCSDKKNWPEAVVGADKLLHEALKKKRLGGKSMGEKLVKAQRLFTDNDGVWFGHKLRAKIDNDPNVKLKEAEVKQALIGIRQALKDLGALPDGKPADKK
ncbi:MAG TPA: hypothetical protein VMY99_03785 [Nevskiaceae bacterium]|nr:hypothetical protein [Nevskiaceae bacterium]